MKHDKKRMGRMMTRAKQRNKQKWTRGNANIFLTSSRAAICTYAVYAMVVPRREDLGLGFFFAVEQKDGSRWHLSSLSKEANV